MKRLALVAALAVLPACTTIHEDRRALTRWNWEFIKDTAVAHREGGGSSGLDKIANPVINWVFVEPVAIVLLPISWLGDTLIVNPIEGFAKAEVQTYNRRFGHDDEIGVSESGVQNAQYAPGITPPIVGNILYLPEFAMHWLWNSTYWTAPVDKDSWNQYWNDHHEQFSH